MNSELKLDLYFIKLIPVLSCLNLFPYVVRF